MRTPKVFICLALAACAASGERSEELRLFKLEDPAMGTLFRASIYARDADEAATAWDAAMDRVAEIEAVASDYDAESELRELCERPVGEWTRVSADLFALLIRSRELTEMTDGAFDPSVGPYVRLWRRAMRAVELPKEERLSEAASAVGMEHLELSSGRARLLVEGMRLDLGAIAKGYALDEALKVLARHGHDHALLDGGGDVVAGAPPPNTSGWVVAVSPLGADGPAWALELKDQAVATSGDASQFVVIEGERYSHIVDPRSGRALRGSRAAAVIAQDGATADALASAVCVMGEDGISLLSLLPGAEACYWGSGFTHEGACATQGLGWMMAPPPEHEVTSPRLR